jgi:hypothetical protein
MAGRMRSPVLKRAEQRSVLRTLRRFSLPWLLLFSLLLALAAVPAWNLEGKDGATVHALLTVQSGLLLSILALVGIFSFLLAQLPTRYTPRVFTRVFDAWTLGYALAYLAGVALPVVVLALGSPVWGVRLSLLVGVFCVLLLVPYSFKLKGALSLERTIDAIRGQTTAQYLDLLRQVGRALRPTQPWQGHQVPEGVRILENIAIAAFGSRDYAVVRRCISSLVQVGASAAYAELDRDVKEQELRSYVQRLRHLALRVQEIPEASREGINALKDLGAVAADQGLHRVSFESVRSLVRVGANGSHKGLEGPPSEAATALAELGITDLAQGADAAAQLVVSSLAGLAATAGQRGQEEATCSVIAGLRRIGETAAKHGKALILLEVAGELGRLGQAAAQRRLGTAASQAVDALTALADVSPHTSRSRIFLAVLRGMDVTARASAHKGLSRSASHAAVALGRLAAASLWEGDSQVPGEAIASLKGLATVASLQDLSDVALEVAVHLWQLGAAATSASNHPIQEKVSEALRVVARFIRSEGISRAYHVAETALGGYKTVPPKVDLGQPPSGLKAFRDWHTRRTGERGRPAEGALEE